jgi:hypothetical protein
LINKKYIAPPLKSGKIAKNKINNRGLVMKIKDLDGFKQLALKVAVECSGYGQKGLEDKTVKTLQNDLNFNIGDFDLKQEIEFKEFDLSPEQRIELAEFIDELHKIISNSTANTISLKENTSLIFRRLQICILFERENIFKDFYDEMKKVYQGTKDQRPTELEKMAKNFGEKALETLQTHQDRFPGGFGTEERLTDLEYPNTLVAHIIKSDKEALSKMREGEKGGWYNVKETKASYIRTLISSVNRATFFASLSSIVSQEFNPNITFLNCVKDIASDQSMLCVLLLSAASPAFQTSEIDYRILAMDTIIAFANLALATMAFPSLRNTVNCPHAAKIAGAGLVLSAVLLYWQYNMSNDQASEHSRG